MRKGVKIWVKDRRLDKRKIERKEGKKEEKEGGKKRKESKE